MYTIGVLAIQGSFFEHRVALHRLGINAPEIKLPHHLNNIDGLIIPGGESTTIVQLIDIYGFRSTLSEKVHGGMPLWGTCAGMIVVANRLTDDRPNPLSLMDIEVNRNAFGRQIDSFEEDIEIANIGDPPFRAVFIRAPVVTKTGKAVKILAKLKNGCPVAVKQNHILATAFHPELTDDLRVHKMFTEIVKNYKPGQS